MTTTRQIERLWGAKTYNRLLGDLLVGRSENLPRVRVDVDTRLASAAIGVVRLDEYNQSHTSFYGTLLRTILSAQQTDGGWGDPMTTALCLRALLCGRGNGLAIQRGCEALANLQELEVNWSSWSPAIRSHVIMDVWHAMARIKVPKEHGFQ